jgi:hypothetical protein
MANLHERSGDVLSLLRKSLNVVLLISIVGEMVFFPSLDNFAGCIMEVIVWIIYRTFFLKKHVMIKHPFSSLAFMSIFFARYIPLPATLLEGKPMTFGFENPLETFFWDTLMFITASLAFYTVVYSKKRQNNILQKALYKLQFFKADATSLWFLGAVGVLARIQNLSVVNEVQYGDVGSKFLDGFIYLQYAPLIMLFPSLSGIEFNKRRNNLVLAYGAIIFILSFASNSRQQMIYPIFTVILLFLLYLIKENISIYNFFSPIKILFIVIIVVFGLNYLSDLSVAMLANRAIRNDISRTELFDKTLETINNEGLMDELRSATLKEEGGVLAYNSGWDETYLDNFMLNRYGNMRVVDRTIYYANKIGFGNKMMQQSFFEKAIATYPTPILSMLGININKERLAYSPGDMLYYTATGNGYVLGGYRVTSLVGDGLATFSIFCFPIVYVLLFLSFKLMDSFVYFTKDSIRFSTLGLINVFGFLGMFRGSISSNTPLDYILRGFWQECFMFWLIVFISRSLSFKKK